MLLCTSDLLQAPSVKVLQAQDDVQVLLLNKPSLTRPVTPTPTPTNSLLFLINA